MAEMTEQRPVRLAHLAAAALALGSSASDNVDGDEAVVVTGQDRDVAGGPVWSAMKSNASPSGSSALVASGSLNLSSV